MTELTIGDRVLQRYRVVRPLGRGGMGVVLLGRTEGAAGFTRPVVIKRPHSSQAEGRDHNELFAREARILAQLQHPNIVSVLDFGLEGDSYVMVLEYVHGYDLNQWLRLITLTGRQLDHEDVLYIVRRVLLALQYAHELKRPDGAPANIVHRDVSLSNVLLDVGAQVKLHDFGIARMDGSDEQPTATGVFKGKLSFAAPELLRGRKATPCTDIYAAAVMLYQLLAGQSPFKGETEAETMFRVLEHVPPALSTFRDDLPNGLDEVVARALDKDPSKRFASAAQFAEELGNLCTRSEEVVSRGLARQLIRDFAQMPSHLRVESLTERDGAWREAQNLPADSQVPLSSSPPSGASGQDRHTDGAPSGEHFESEAAALRTSREFGVSAAPVRKRSVAPGGRALAIVVGAGGIALAVLSLTVRSDAPAPSPNYLVLENAQNPPLSRTATAPSATSTPPSQAPLAEAAATTSRATKNPAPKAATKKPRATEPDARALSTQFRAHQPAVEACFKRRSGALEPMPKVFVRFEVDRSGRVTEAKLTPATVETTPLGRCLLEVARAARFGPLSEPVAFSIPITAQRVAK